MTAIAPIPLTITAYDRGASGVPSRTNPTPIVGITNYEDAISNQFGFESLRIAFESSVDEALEWLRGGLMRPIESVKPSGATRWDGLIYEISATFGKVTIVLSLEDMANRLRVKYATDSGSQTKTSTYSNAGSIAVYGIKDQVLNLSTVTATAAANRAQSALASLAWPTSKRATQSGSSGTGGRITVEIKAVGWYETLDWVLTSSTSTTVTATNTQVANLLSSYNAVNNWFSTSTTAIVATGISDTEYIDPETSYREKLETLLAQGNSAQQRVVWGIFDNTRAMTVRVWAGATPSAISYYESARDGTVRDPYGNIVAPWDLAPDAMCETVDLFDAPPFSDQVASVTRKYVGRVTLRIDSGGVQAALEPDDVTSVEAALAGPVGAGPAGQSARQTKIERKIKKQISATVPTSDSPSYTPSGVLKPSKGGTGIANSDTSTLTLSSAGTLDLGGGTLTLGPSLTTSGAGATLTLSTAGAFTLTIPATGTATLGTGTSGRVAEWAGTNTVQASTLAKTGAGVLTLTSGATTLTLTISGGSGQIDFTTPTTGDALIYDGTKFTPTAAPSGNGTTGRVAKWTSATALGADTLAKTGAGILTLTSGATTLTLTLSGGSATLDFSTPTSGDVLAYNGTIFTPTAPTVYAPTNATYIVQTANGTLSAEQVLASLATGFMKVTTTTGVITSQADISLTADVIGTLPIANGGTGATTAPTAIAALGGLSGNGLAGQIAVYTGTLSVSSFSNFTFNDTTNVLTVTGSVVAAENSAFGTSSKPTSTRLLTKGSGTSSATKSLQAQNSAATEHMYVRDDGQLGARVAWTIFSDRRLKRNIRDVETGLAKNVLKIIQDLPDPVLFDYTNGAPDQIGYLADELQAVLPQIVQTITPESGADTPADLLGVQYTNLIPILLLGLKQLIPLIGGAQSRANNGPRPDRPRLR